MPISLVRSATETSMMLMIPMPPTIKGMAATLPLPAKPMSSVSTGSRLPVTSMSDLLLRTRFGLRLFIVYSSR
jgi:hypothetical protein